MTKSVSATELRQQVYRLLDQVLETGEPLEITRKGRRLRLVPDSPPDRLARIAPLPRLIAGDPDDLVSSDWSGEWDAGRAIDP